MDYRVCAICRKTKHKFAFKPVSWNRGRRATRCNQCVSGGSKRPAPTRVLVPAGDSARLNISGSCSINPKPFAQGAFRLCCKGTYTEGRRRGEACVAKYFKSGTYLSTAFFNNDIKAVSRALQIVRAFNRQSVLNRTIVVSIPEVWTGKQGQKILVEPFIKGFVKWNSNSGWSDEYTAWARLMQALSHFSYHYSQGQFLLCDLQGGIYDKGAVLTDPVIMSRTRQYGVTDLGAEGMSNFFAGHNCNEYCSRSWIHPTGSRLTINAVKGTTMKYIATERRKPRFTYAGR